MKIKTNFNIGEKFYFPIRYTKDGEVETESDIVIKIIITSQPLRIDDNSVYTFTTYFGKKFGQLPTHLIFKTPEEAIGFTKNPHNVIITGCKVIK